MLYLTLDLEFHDAIKGVNKKEKEMYIFEQDIILKKIFSLLNENNIRISCFVTDEFVKNFYDFFHKYVVKRHEVCCHTSSHLFYRGNNIDDFIKEMRMNKNYLERETGLKCKGFRAPSGVVPNNLISILKKLSFKYDSSIVPGFMPGRFNHSKAPKEPYFPDPFNILIPNKNKNNEIIEFPTLTSKFLKLSMSGIFLSYYNNFIDYKKFESIYGLMYLHAVDFKKFHIFEKSYFWDKLKNTKVYWKFLEFFVQKNKNKDITLCELYQAKIDQLIPILEKSIF